MEIRHIDSSGSALSKLVLSDEVFGREFNGGVLHQVIVAYLARARAGTRAQKTRAQVAHSTKKPHAQKGTGKARAGMTSSPIWRGGGRAFPSSPAENFAHKVNKKMYRVAMKVILSALVREQRMCAIDTFHVEAPKTKLLADKISRMGVSGNLLIVVHELSEHLYLASRNLVNVEIADVQYVNPVALARVQNVIITSDAIKKLERMLI